MPTRVILTKEEKKEDYKDIEMMLRNNMTYSQIANEIGRSAQYVANIRADLASRGILTEDELNSIKEKFQKEKEKQIDKRILSLLEQGCTRNEIHKKINMQPRDINDSIDRLIAEGIDITQFKTRKEIERENRKSEIKKLVKKGYYKERIANETHIPRVTVNRLVEELIAENEIKREDVKFSKELLDEKNKTRNERIKDLYNRGVSPQEIADTYDVCESTIFNVVNDKKHEIKSHKRKKVYEIKEIDDSLTQEEIDVVNYLKKGYSYVVIRKILSKEQTDVMQIVNKLKKGKYITQAIINDALKKRKEYYRLKIKELLKKGYSQADIIRYLNQDVEEVTSATVSRTVTSLLNEGEITEEIIKDAVDNSSSSFKSIDTKVLQYLQQGLNVKEIVEIDEDGYLTKSRVRMSKKRLVKNKKITPEEITAYRKKKEKYEKEQVYKNEEKIIWNYISKEGLTIEEISKKMGQCTAYINTRLLNIRNRKKLTLKDVYRIRKEALLKKYQKTKEMLEEENKKKEKLLEKYNKVKKEVLYYINILENKDDLYDEFVTLFKELIKYKNAILKSDIDLLSEVVLYIEKYNKDIHASYVIDLFLKINAYEDAKRFFIKYHCEKNKNSEFYTETYKKLQKIKI